MLTRRKSSEQFTEVVQKKIKSNSGQAAIVNDEVELDSPEKKQKAVSELKKFIKNVTTRRLLKKRGIQKLFPIQEQTFNLIHSGGDLIAQDRTGSGKTLAYCLPLCEQMRENGKFLTTRYRPPMVLVIVPTRELVIQVATELNKIKHSDNEFTVLSLYGGTSISEQVQHARNGGEFIIATPGRLQDIMERNILRFDQLQTFILDEADQMLQLGFQDDIENIYNTIKQAHPKLLLQCLMFSATIPVWMRKFSEKYMKADRKIINLIKLSENQTVSTVKHYALPCAFGMSISTLGDIVSVYGGRHSRTIIFCETKAQANDILSQAKLPMELQVLHGDIPQKQREVTFNSFKTGKLKCLVATNVASRGLDFPEVDLILQLQPPKEVDTYIHRAGRTARAGKEGICITFFNKKQQFLVDRIERQAKIRFIMINSPQPLEIIKASKRDLLVSLQQVSQDIVELFRPVVQEIMQQVDVEDALSRALACMSGYKDKIQYRSMLGSFEGYITYVIKSTVPFRSFSYIWNFLRKIFPQNLVDSIKGMKMLRNEAGVVFDLPELEKENFEQGFQNYLAEGQRVTFTFEIPTSLPEFVDPSQRSNQSYLTEQPRYGAQNSYSNSRPEAKKSTTEVFIGGLDYQTTEQNVREFVESYDVKLKSFRLLKDHEGNSKGIAFALCQEPDMIQKLLDLEGQKLNGRKLRINMADQKPNK